MGGGTLSESSLPFFGRHEENPVHSFVLDCFFDVVEKAYRVVRWPFDLPWFQLIENVAPEEGVEEEAAVFGLWMRELDERSC